MNFKLSPIALTSCRDITSTDGFGLWYHFYRGVPKASSTPSSFTKAMQCLDTAKRDSWSMKVIKYGLSVGVIRYGVSEPD